MHGSPIWRCRLCPCWWRKIKVSKIWFLVARTKFQNFEFVKFALWNYICFLIFYDCVFRSDFFVAKENQTLSCDNNGSDLDYCTSKGKSFEENFVGKISFPGGGAFHLAYGMVDDKHVVFVGLFDTNEILAIDVTNPETLSESDIVLLTSF